MGLSIQPQFPASLPTVPIEIGGWVNPEMVRVFRRKISYTCQDSNPKSSSMQPSYYGDYVIPAPNFWEFPTIFDCHK